MDYTKVINLIGAAITSTLTFVFGVPDIWMLTFIALIVVDYISGLIKGAITDGLSSSVGIKGILKKVLYFGVIAVAVMIDVLVGANGLLRTSIIGFFIANESISILENAGEAGLPIPTQLLDYINKFKDKEIEF